MRRAALLCALTLLMAACSNDLDVAVELEAATPTPVPATPTPLAATPTPLAATPTPLAATPTPLAATPTPVPTPVVEVSVEAFCALDQRFEDSAELDLAFEVVTGEEPGDRRAAGAQINAAFDEFFAAAPPQVKDEVGQIRAVFAQIVQLVSTVPDGQVLPEEITEQLFERFVDPELEAAGAVLEDFTDEFCDS